MKNKRIPMLASSAILIASHCAATPMLQPLANRVAVQYEGGYKLQIASCENVLCVFEFSGQGRRFALSQASLAKIVEPRLDLVKVYIYPLGATPESIAVEIPLIQYGVPNPHSSRVARIDCHLAQPCELQILQGSNQQ